MSNAWFVRTVVIVFAAAAGLLAYQQAQYPYINRDARTWSSMGDVNRTIGTGKEVLHKGDTAAMTYKNEADCKKGYSDYQHVWVPCTTAEAKEWKVNGVQINWSVATIVPVKQ